MTPEQTRSIIQYIKSSITLLCDQTGTKIHASLFNDLDFLEEQLNAAQAQKIELANALALYKKTIRDTIEELRKLKDMIKEL